MKKSKRKSRYYSKNKDSFVVNLLERCLGYISKVNWRKNEKEQNTCMFWKCINYYVWKFRIINIIETNIYANIE